MSEKFYFHIKKGLRMKKLLTSLFVTGALLSANAVVLADTCNMPATPSTTYEYTATNSDCGCPNKKKDTCKENKKACNDNCKSAYKNNDCDCGCQKEKDPCDPCKKNTGFFGFFRNMFNK